ncbi:hypothetical protein LY90DRAFT_499351 [Neocallimastix californiae]|uniref:Uncharacterized protein n=1 Tax=Neocallimastix californiae TaxID=1754190 RepID=A0A1Y2FL54_9FUNG|nr:hypothetical protein LY90DRAFT_499351 [Neocallimastix californiae]|eukprot:ORY83926.1 hypothetical protein LY90DRAFT_499351 [Neocallimastix californiae]
MSNFYKKNKISLKIVPTTDVNVNDTQRFQVSQSVPSTPIERNINQLMLEKYAYRSLLLVDKSLKNLENLEEEKKNKDDEDFYDSLQNLKQRSSSIQPLREVENQQQQQEYVYASSSTIKQSFAPKLRRSYSQQLKKLSKSPRLSYIQPKIQPQAQNNLSRSNRPNSNNSISNTTSNHKIYKQSVQNYNNNNRKSLIDGVNYNNSNIRSNYNDYSSMPASPVFLLKRNINNGHNSSTSNVNNTITNEFSERSIGNVDNNYKAIQSESVIASSLSSYSYNSKSNKLKNPILDDQNDIQYILSPTSENEKEIDEEYCSDNSNNGIKMTKSKNIPVSSKRNSIFDNFTNSIANSNCSSYSEKYTEISFSNIMSDIRSSTINGQQIYPILYSDPLDNYSNKNGNESFSYTINIKKNLIKELIETKEKADSEIYEIYSIWLEDKDSNDDNEEGLNKLGYNYNNNSTSYSSLLSLNISNSSINNDDNQSVYDSTESLNNNINNILNNNSNESLTTKSNTSFPTLYQNNNNYNTSNISSNSSLFNNNFNEYSDIPIIRTSSYNKNKETSSIYKHPLSNNSSSERLSRHSNISLKIQDSNQRKVFGNKDVNIFKEKIKKSNKANSLAPFKQENKRLSNSMDCLVLAYSNNNMKRKSMQGCNSYGKLNGKNNKIHGSLENLDYSLFNNIKNDYNIRRESSVSKHITTNLNNENRNSRLNNNGNENFEFYLRPRLNQVYSKSWPPSIFTSSHTKLIYKIEQVVIDILKTPAEKYIGSSVAIDFMKILNDLINEQKSLIVGDPEAEDILTKLLYVFSPVVRISEFYNQYISTIEKIENDETDHLKYNRISYNNNKGTSKLISGINLNNESDSMSCDNQKYCESETSNNVINISNESYNSLKEKSENENRENSIMDHFISIDEKDEIYCNEENEIENKEMKANLISNSFSTKDSDINSITSPKKTSISVSFDNPINETKKESFDKILNKSLITTDIEVPKEVAEDKNYYVETKKRSIQDFEEGNEIEKDNERDNEKENKKERENEKEQMEEKIMNEEIEKGVEMLIEIENRKEEEKEKEVEKLIEMEKRQDQEIEKGVEKLIEMENRQDQEIEKGVEKLIEMENRQDQEIEKGVENNDLLTDNNTINEENRNTVDKKSHKKKDKGFMGLIKSFKTLKSTFSPFSSSQSIASITDSTDESISNSNENISNSLKHKRSRSDSNKISISRLNRALSKKKTSHISNCPGSCNTESDNERKIDSLDMNNRDTSPNESTNNNVLTSPLYKCFTPEDINEKSVTDNTAPMISTTNVIATATISSPATEKSEKIESTTNDTNDINDINGTNDETVKHDKETSSIKTVSASSKTIDDTKPKNTVLCRICEEMILAENLGEHSKVCAVIQEQEMRLYESTQKLKKLYSDFKSLKCLMDKKQLGLNSKMLEQFDSIFTKLIDIDVKSSKHRDDQDERLERYTSKLKKILDERPINTNMELYNIGVSLKTTLINELQAVRSYKALEKKYNKTRIINIPAVNDGSHRNSIIVKDKSTQDVNSTSEKSLNSTTSAEKNRLSGIYQHDDSPKKFFSLFNELIRRANYHKRVSSIGGSQKQVMLYNY